MKKLILLALMAIMMAGCDKVKKEVSSPLVNDYYKVLTIDSCEYVADGYRLAHKGNCRFCKERRQKELEELVIRIKGK